MNKNFYYFLNIVLIEKFSINTFCGIFILKKSTININKIKCTKLEKYINKYKKSLKIVKKYVKLILIRVYEYYINII